MLKLRPMILMTPPKEGDKFLTFLYQIGVSKKFESFIMLMISINTVMMAINK